MKDFVSFELAKKLKEKGYPQKTFGGYDMVGACYYKDGRFYKDGCVANVNDCYTCPEIHQVLKWLREEKKIHVAIGYSGETEWRYVIVFLGDKYFENPNIIHKHFNSYESAALAGIEYILDKLI